MTDLRELQAACGENVDVAERLTRSVRVSTLCKVLESDGEPVVIFGVAPLSVIAREGAPWLIATDMASDMEYRFARLSKRLLPLMIGPYLRLYNYIDVRNETTMRWLKWLGFSISEPLEYGVNGELFMRFEMEADYV